MAPHRTRFVFCIHAHQPVGQQEDVLNRIYNECYSPLIHVLENFPKIPVVLHFSGALLEWLERAKPEFLLQIQRLVKRGQAELLGGGFYEPILTMIPEYFRARQIQEHARFLESHFTYLPKGIWLAERVWEPSLVSTLCEEGMSYTLLDDNLFKMSGIKDDALHGAFLTEENGKTITLFPISKHLRYLIPFSAPEKTVDYLMSLSGKNNGKNGKSLSSLCVYADDAEKFGSWPGTHKLVYQDKWLERFFTLLLDRKESIRMLTFSQYLAEHNVQTKVYPSAGSYEEMLSWCGGNFRNFFIKFPEANLMHKRMLFVSRLYAQKNHKSDADAKKVKSPGERTREAAEKELLKSQCNDAYWHGVFGGLYIDFLRQSVFRHLLKAEATLLKPARKPFFRTAFDADSDGIPEIYQTSPAFSLIIKPDRGAGLLELSSKQHGFNLLSFLSGNGKITPGFTEYFFQREPYHLHKELMSGVLPAGNTFSDAFYDMQVHEKKNECTLHCVHSGEIRMNSHDCRVMVKKSYTVKDKPHLDIHYELSNLYHEPMRLTFCSRMGFAAVPGCSEILCGKEKFPLSVPAAAAQKEEAHFPSAHFTLSLQVQPAADFVFVPVSTFFHSERGQEKNTQGVLLFPLWTASIPPGSAEKFSIHLKLK